MDGLFLFLKMIYYMYIHIYNPQKTGHNIMLTFRKPLEIAVFWEFDIFDEKSGKSFVIIL